MAEDEVLTRTGMRIHGLAATEGAGCLTDQGKGLWLRRGQDLSDASAALAATAKVYCERQGVSEHIQLNVWEVTTALMFSCTAAVITHQTPSTRRPGDSKRYRTIRLTADDVRQDIILARWLIF
jgi:hypothetical protein